MPTAPLTDPDSRPAQFMFTALHATHQHADAKAGILAAAQAALVGTAGSWNAPALHAAAAGGVTGVLAGTLLVLFLGGLLGGAGFLAATLRPRVLRPTGVNRYSFVHLASGPDILPARHPHADPPGSGQEREREQEQDRVREREREQERDPGQDRERDPDQERRELSQTIRFLSQVAVRKYRCLTAAVACTAVMGISAALLVVLRPVLN
ncbi:hypothetical protein AB0L74_08570 [Streptomyces sp. NPDC052020]|uniref:hypothetical protein n=1 Tax=Streptomyces sp. NPDC052020 TaxID=3155677 RepID=UPI003411F872